MFDNTVLLTLKPYSAGVLLLVTYKRVNNLQEYY